MDDGVAVGFPDDHHSINYFKSRISMGRIADDINKHYLSVDYNMDLESVPAFQANAVTTVDGNINGHYSGSDVLALFSSDGNIDVDLDFSQVKSSAATLSLTTSNGNLKAKIRLHDHTSKNTGTNFRVSTVVYNGNTDISFLDVPLYSTLNHKSVTTNGNAEVTIHPTFEGHFFLGSNSDSTPACKGSYVVDPYGKDRHRISSTRSFPGVIEGDVSWGGDTKGRGSVSVITSRGLSVLNL